MLVGERHRLGTCALFVVTLCDSSEDGAVYVVRRDVNTEREDPVEPL